MPKYVITPEVALRLAREGGPQPDGRQLLAPTLLRSQLLALLYASVRRGELTAKEAERVLDAVRALRLRLLGDRVLQSTAWRIAEQLDHPDTLAAEYLALARLQADALVTLDPALASAARGVVPVVGFEELSGPQAP